MKIPLNDNEILTHMVTQFSETSNYQILSELFTEIINNYSTGGFNVIGEWDFTSECKNYLSFKIKELVHSKQDLLYEMFIKDNVNVLLSGIDGNKRDIEYQGSETNSATSAVQNENSPINNNISDIQTPIFKQANKGESTKSFNNRKDVHTFKSIDDIIRKYNYLNNNDFTNLHYYCERYFVMPLIDEFNTVY